MGNNNVRIIIFVFLALVILSSGYFILDFEYEEESDNGFNSSVSYVSEFNISESNRFEVETDYISFDGMRSFDSNSISVESESCLRFTDFDGEIVMGSETDIKGDASGFATCTLNATTNIQVKETKSVSKISTQDLINYPSYSFENVNTTIELLNQDKKIEETNVEVTIDEFNGSMELKPPNTLNLYGMSGLKIENREIN